jgi:hypothetical protein
MVATLLLTRIECSIESSQGHPAVSRKVCKSYACGTLQRVEYARMNIII